MENETMFLGRRSGHSYNDISTTNELSATNIVDRRSSHSWDRRPNENFIQRDTSNEVPRYDHKISNSSSGKNVLELDEDDENKETNSTNGNICTSLQSITENRLKKRLRYFFMNPIEKWRCKRRLPWKLTVQIFKILIVTTQVSMFASQRYDHVSYLWDTKISFSHLFIKNWDSSMEMDSYPPSSGPLALYEIEDFYESLDYAILMFSKIEKSALGTYKFAKQGGLIHMPQFCYSRYKKCQVDLDNLTYAVDKEIIEKCIDISSSVFSNGSNWSIKKYLHDLEHNINFDLLLGAKLSLWLRTIRLTLELPFQAPECYELENNIYYNNRDHDGQMVIDSEITANVLDCQGFVDSVDESQDSNLLRNVLNIITLCVCVVSFIMCFRSLYRGQQLRIEADKYFSTKLSRSLSSKEKFEFVNCWYILICISDMLLVTGTVIKMNLEGKDYEGFLDKWTYCALFLGTGNLLLWFGFLRYLGCFDTYNVLILTIKSCFPNVIRFSVCMLLVFSGYALCGWLVLGPYNLKFRSFSSTVECLFALINGDDMFSTFASCSTKDAVVWWFSRIYLYSFISLFIYVILSLFIAIIMDSYDTIKKYYKEGFPKSGLMQFAFECEDDPYCGGYLDDEERTIYDIVNSFLCCSYWRYYSHQEDVSA